MQASERGDFKTELEKLCAGFGVPFTRAREESYWTGLARMSIQQFRRCVEFALGPDYDGTDFPKTGQIWGIYKGTAIKPNPEAKALPADQDHLAYLANQLLWIHVSHRGGLGSTGVFIPAHGMVDCKASGELQRCLKFKRELVAQFCGFVQDSDDMATPAAFIRWWLGGLRKVSELLPRTVKTLEEMAEHADAQKPFPIWMARDIAPTQPELV
jgi:hypothetical protein